MKSQRLEAKWMDNGDKPISLVRERYKKFIYWGQNNNKN